MMAFMVFSVKSKVLTFFILLSQSIRSIVKSCACFVGSLWTMASQSSHENQVIVPGYISFTSNKLLHLGKSLLVFILILLCFLLNFFPTACFYCLENYLSMMKSFQASAIYFLIEQTELGWGDVFLGNVYKISDRRSIRTQIRIVGKKEIFQMGF